jgi:hypothetical protein
MLKGIENLKQILLLQVFTIYLRFLIGSAFIIAAIGMGKLNTSNVPLDADSFPLDASTPPMILFFKVMYESGLYWKFIGWIQIIAGGLLMTQRYAKIGAIIFFGIILNIFVITISYEFNGTPIVTGLMLLAIIYLLIWDIQSLKFLFIQKGFLKYENLKVAGNNYWVILGIVMISTIVIMSILKIKIFLLLFILFIEGLIGLITFFSSKRKFMK